MSIQDRNTLNLTNQTELFTDELVDQYPLSAFADLIIDETSSHSKHRKRSSVKPAKLHNCCTDREGNIKTVYSCKYEALDVAKLRSVEAGLKINIYKCRYGEGWHLTKKNE